MLNQIPLYRELFCEKERILFKSDGLEVTAFKYDTGVEALRIVNNKGYIIVLPWYGQMIWDANFDDLDLKLDSFFRKPYPSSNITGTYGCFAFHSGLLANGCPGPEDNHPLHGEFPCTGILETWLEIRDEHISIIGTHEYLEGFGHHYRAQPSITMKKNCSLLKIDMAVTNLSNILQMPLQYMCHINYRFFEGAVFSQNIPDTAFILRQSIPEHVRPTQQWLDFNSRILSGDIKLEGTAHAELYDPEIVSFADYVQKYTDNAKFYMQLPSGIKILTEFNTHQFTHVTRWILNNSDMRVAAYALPATCRPEGAKAAGLSKDIIYLSPGETKEFSVITGIE